jgi:hypothetical protein
MPVRMCLKFFEGGLGLLIIQQTDNVYTATRLNPRLNAHASTPCLNAAPPRGNKLQP